MLTVINKSHILKYYQTYLFALNIISVYTSVLYYDKIKYNRSFKEFIFNLFLYRNKRNIHITFDYRRQKYYKVNNYCLVIFWISLILELINIFNN